MDLVKLQDIVAVSGYPGLYKIIGRSKSGIIVEAMDATKKRMSVSLTTKVSVLNEIAMYSKTDDVNLGIIFLNIKNGNPSVPAKNAQPNDLKSFMSIALPDFDEERVYLSHIQKLANWYSIIGDVVDYEDLKQIHFPEEKKEEKPVKAKKETAKETTKEEETATPAAEKKPRKSTKKATEEK